MYVMLWYNEWKWNVPLFCTTLYICSFITVCTILVILVYTVLPLSQLFLLVPLFALFIDNLRYISRVHNVCTVSAILYFIFPFVEVEYTVWWLGTTYSRVGSFSLHMRRNGIISSSDLKSVVTRFQRHRFSIISTEILVIWQSFVVFCHILVPWKGNFRVFGYNSDNAIWLSNPDF